MHSRIFELSDEELSEEAWMQMYDIPEWFYGTVADYAKESENRDADLGWLRESLKGVATLEGNTLSFCDDARVVYFKGKHEAFLRQLDELKSVTLEEFAGTTDNFSTKMHFLNSLYNEEFEFYFYHNDCFRTMDEWLRYADLTHPFFVGGVFDYHY